MVSTTIEKDKCQYIWANEYPTKKPQGRKAATNEKYFLTCLNSIRGFTSSTTVNKNKQMLLTLLI